MIGSLYRKAGRTFRVEFLRGTLSTLAVSEWGEAREEGARFVAIPSRHELDADPPAAEPLLRLAEELLPLKPERFVLLGGNATHETSKRRWTEPFTRLHVSLAPAETRVSFDLGGSAPGDVDLSPVLEANGLLQHLRPASTQRTAIALAPPVVASLWPALVGDVAGIVQSTHPVFRFDGDGREIRDAEPGGQWPNRFRPSYRSRPIPAPFHLHASLPPSQEPAEFTAIALIEPFAIGPTEIHGRLLFREGFAATVRFPLTALRATNAPHHWFPYVAGVYAQQTIVELAELSP